MEHLTKVFTWAYIWQFFIDFHPLSYVNRNVGCSSWGLQNTTSNRHDYFIRWFLWHLPTEWAYIYSYLFIYHRRDYLVSCIRAKFYHHSTNSLAKCFQSSENDHILLIYMNKEGLKKLEVVLLLIMFRIYTSGWSLRLQINSKALFLDILQITRIPRPSHRKFPIKAVFHLRLA